MSDHSLFCSKQRHHKCFSVCVNSVDINASIFMLCHSKDFSMSVFCLLNGQRVSDYGQVIAHLIRQVTQPSPCVKVNKAIFFIAVSVIREGHGENPSDVRFFHAGERNCTPVSEDETTWKAFILCRLRSALFFKVKCAIKIVSSSLV